MQSDFIGCPASLIGCPASPPASPSSTLSELEDRLRATRGDIPAYMEVSYRHGVIGEDKFVMNPGYMNFNTVEMGEVLAYDRFGPVLAPEEGRIFLPLYNSQGEDGFFVVCEAEEDSSSKSS